MDAATVVVRKLTGETIECQADLSITVDAFKHKIAEKASVPALCQRLTLHDVDEKFSESLLQHMIPYHLQRVGKPIEDLSKSDVAEVKAFRNPPRMVVSCLTVVLALVGSSRLIGSKRDAEGVPSPLCWEQCKFMMRDVKNFLGAVQNWPQEVLGGEVSESQVRRAEELVEQSQPFDPRHMARASLLASRLCEWVLEALKFYRVDAPRLAEQRAGGIVSVELENLAPLDIYCQDKSEFHLSLVADLEPVWSALQAHDKQLPAIQALGVLGSKCPQRALQELASKLTEASDQLREAALHSLQAFTKDTTEAATLLLESLPAPRTRQPTTEAMAALVHVGPSDFRVLEWIINALNSGSDETRHVALQLFNSMEEHADADKVIGCIITSMFQAAADDPPSSQAYIFDALATASKRNYQTAISLLSERLQPTQPTWVQSRAAAAAAKTAAEEERSITAALRELLKSLTGGHLVVVAAGLLQISPASYGEAIESLCLEMNQNRSIDRLETITALSNYARESDMSVIDALSTYLLHAKRVLEKDGTPPIMAALRTLKRVAEPYPERIHEARTGVMAALAAKTAATGGKEYIGKLAALAKEQGAPPRTVLVELLKGFQNHNSSVREACKGVFGKLCQPGDDTAIDVVMKAIQSDVYGWSRCAAIEMLPKIVAVPRPDVTGCLMELCREADVAIQSAALGAMRLCASPSGETAEVARSHLQDTDESVRLEAMQGLAALEPKQELLLDVLLESTEDEASIVIVTAVDLMANVPVAGREKEICHRLAGLLQHANSQVREAAASALGRMTGDGRALAIGALEQQTHWPETDIAVLRAREGARQKLETDP
ncbi:unnamed protein product [Symbiodinium sp. CCMP2592]|nr:unnamed protein product [Symbiodinium sp. CCMP2592]